jgi:membrane-associated phospholipid phosphatase
MSKLNKTTFLLILFGTGFYWLSYAFLDKPIAYFFHDQTTTGMAHDFFQAITLLADPKIAISFILISLIIALPLLLKQSRNKLASNLLWVSIAMVLAICLETSLKYLLGRYRPQLLFQDGLYGFHYLSHQFLMNSTPSGHATRFFVFVTGFSLIWQRLAPLFILFGILVCASRLVLQFHFLSDVVFGALLGLLVTLWTAKIYQLFTFTNSRLIPFKSRYH